MKNILVINALNGSIPLVLQKKYPSARITCAEVFSFFREHLTNLGFAVVDWDTAKNMKFDLIIGNPPYNSNDTVRENSQHRGQGDNIAKKFTLQCLEIYNQKMMLVLPYGHRTYSPALAEQLRKNGLYKITSCENHFPSVDSNPCVFWFDKTKIVNIVDDQYYKHSLDIPEKNLGQIFRNQPGRLNRQDYEDKLTDKGKYQIVVTTSVVKFTNDVAIVEGMKDKTRGNWRVVFNCTTSKRQLGKVIIAPPDAVLSKSVHCLICESQTSAEKIKDYLESNSVKAILQQVKTVNACNSKKFLEYIPLP